MKYKGITKPLVCLLVMVITLITNIIPVKAAVSFNLTEHDRGCFIDVLSKQNSSGEYYYNLTYKRAKEEISECFFTAIYVQVEDGSTSEEDIGVKETEIDVVITTKNKDNIEYMFNYTAYKNLPKKQQKNYMNDFVEDILSSGMSKDGLQRLYYCLESYDDSIMNRYITEIISEATAVDLATATSELNPVLVYFRVILGVLVILVFLGFSLSTLLDISWLVIDIFHDMITHEGKPKYISNTAYKAYAAQESGECNVALFYYVKQRIVVFIVLVACISYLLLGRLGDAFGLIGEMFPGGL